MKKLRTLLISPYSRPLRNGKWNPKNYPYFDELVEVLRGKVKIVQIGLTGEPMIKNISDIRQDMSLEVLKEVILEADTWISVDNFFHHYCWTLGKKGVVIFGQSDPVIFGHKENINLLKGREYLRPRQFAPWEEAEFNKECFVLPRTVAAEVLRIID